MNYAVIDEDNNRVTEYYVHPVTGINRIQPKTIAPMAFAPIKDDINQTMSYLDSFNIYNFSGIPENWVIRSEDGLKTLHCGGFLGDPTIAPFSNYSDIVSWRDNIPQGTFYLSAVCLLTPKEIRDWLLAGLDLLANMPGAIWINSADAVADGKNRVFLVPEGVSWISTTAIGAYMRYFRELVRSADDGTTINNIVKNAVVKRDSNSRINAESGLNDSDARAPYHVLVKGDTARTPTALKLPIYDANGRILSTSFLDIHTQGNNNIVITKENVSATPVANRVAIYDSVGRLNTKAQEASELVGNTNALCKYMLGLTLNSEEQVIPQAISGKIPVYDSNGKLVGSTTVLDDHMSNTSNPHAVIQSQLDIDHGRVQQSIVAGVNQTINVTCDIISDTLTKQNLTVPGRQTPFILITHNTSESQEAFIKSGYTITVSNKIFTITLSNVEANFTADFSYLVVAN